MGEEGQEQRAVAGRERSSFAVTCSLLSQYLKEKMAPPPAGEGVFRPPPTTMNLLSALDAPAEPKDAATKSTAEPRAHTSDSVEPFPEAKASTEPPVLAAHTDQQNGENAREEAEEKAQQLTIFYGGKVFVFDNFPATKVKDLLQMVNRGHGGEKASSNAVLQKLPTPSHNLSVTKKLCATDMPIARRNSLHRFLEKRKGRIIAKAPYQVDTSVEASNKQATGEKSWLGLGQEVIVKQEI